MLRLFRFLWKVFIMASVFGIGYIIGREHSFEEDEDWDSDEDASLDKPEEKKSDPVAPITPSATATTATAATAATAGTSAAATGGEGSAAFEHSDPKANSVAVVGDFNDWNKDKHPMKLENGVWKVSISLKPGRHEYKFVVNNTDWITDPKCSETTPDKYGGRSSVMVVS